MSDVEQALIKQLTDEIERLRADMDQRMKAYVEYQEKDEAEIERLRAENVQMREWIERVMAFLRQALNAKAEGK